MMEYQLSKAWGWLVGLSAATTVLTLVDLEGPLQIFAGFLILALAGWKARIILRQYLGLQVSVFWRQSFDVFLGVFLMAAFLLYALALGGINV